MWSWKITGNFHHRHLINPPLATRYTNSRHATLPVRINARSRASWSTDTYFFTTHSIFYTANVTDTRIAFGKDSSKSEAIIFFLFRWFASESESSTDDSTNYIAQGTQSRCRLFGAIESFLVRWNDISRNTSNRNRWTSKYCILRMAADFLRYDLALSLFLY